VSVTVRLSCSFCGMPSTEVGALVAGPGVYICDGCVALAAGAVAAREELLPDVPTVGDALAALQPAATSQDHAERHLVACVQRARALGGTWAQIAAALGTPRESARERFAPGG
jgi:ClpX C4-type zinc finger